MPSIAFSNMPRYLASAARSWFSVSFMVLVSAQRKNCAADCLQYNETYPSVWRASMEKARLSVENNEQEFWSRKFRRERRSGEIFNRERMSRFPSRCPQFLQHRSNLHSALGLQSLEVSVREDRRLHIAFSLCSLINVSQCASRRGHHTIHLTDILAQLGNRASRPILALVRNPHAQTQRPAGRKQFHDRAMTTDEMF